jgi:hypothetical protein
MYRHLHEIALPTKIRVSIPYSLISFGTPGPNSKNDDVAELKDILGSYGVHPTSFKDLVAVRNRNRVWVLSYVVKTRAEAMQHVDALNKYEIKQFGKVVAGGNKTAGSSVEMEKPTGLKVWAYPKWVADIYGIRESTPRVSNMKEHTITKMRQLLSEAWEGSLTGKGWDGNYVLMDKSGHAVGRNSKVKNRDGKIWRLTGGKPPHKPSSSGKIYVVSAAGESREFYPRVMGLQWVKDVVS